MVLFINIMMVPSYNRPRLFPIRQVGFSWERCFDASLEGLASHRHFGSVPPCVSRVVPRRGIDIDSYRSVLKMVNDG